MAAGIGTTSDRTLEMFHHFVHGDGGPRVEPRWHDLMVEYEQRPFRVFYHGLLNTHNTGQGQHGSLGQHGNYQSSQPADSPILNLPPHIIFDEAGSGSILFGAGKFEVPADQKILCRRITTPPDDGKLMAGQISTSNEAGSGTAQLRTWITTDPTTTYEDTPDNLKRSNGLITVIQWSLYRIEERVHIPVLKPNSTYYLNIQNSFSGSTGPLKAYQQRRSSVREAPAEVIPDTADSQPLSNLQQPRAELGSVGAATTGSITHNGERISFSVTPATQYALFIKGPGENGFTYESNFMRSAGNPRTIHANSFNHKPGMWTIMIAPVTGAAGGAADEYTVIVR